MNKISIGVVGAAIALAACQTVKPTNPALDDARRAVYTAAADPAIARAAPAELQRAHKSLMAAESAWAAYDEQDTNSLAYIAKQRANVAREVAARNTAEQRLAEREARERDAGIAQKSASEPNQQATAAAQ